MGALPSKLNAPEWAKGEGGSSSSSELWHPHHAVCGEAAAQQRALPRGQDAHDGAIQPGGDVWGSPQSLVVGLLPQVTKPRPQVES